MSEQSKWTFKDIVILILWIIGIGVGALVFFGVIVPIAAIVLQYAAVIIMAGLFIYGIYTVIFNKQF